MDDISKDILQLILNSNLSNTGDVKGLISTIREKLPVAKPDLILSVVFVDLTRHPVALISKSRSRNFPGFKVDRYNRLKDNYQFTSPNSFIHELVTDQTLIVIENVEELKGSSLGDRQEREFMLENEWKSAIFHSLFHENVNYGYLALFTLDNYLTSDEIDQLLDLMSTSLPYLSSKLLAVAYQWKSDLHRKDLEEIETNLSDLVIAINSDGTIIRVNNLSSYYLDIPPNETLGKNLEEVSPILYHGIKDALRINKKREPMVEVTLDHPSGQPMVLELDAWESTVASDHSIICFATDITLLRLYQREMEDYPS